MNRVLTIALAMALSSSATAQAPDQRPITGWWHATLIHAGEQRDIWLHFEDHDGALVARFSNPTIGVEDAPLSKVTVSPADVELSSLGWRLRRDGDALTGVVADSLIPQYKLKARFVRSAKPPRPPAPLPAERAPKPLWTQSIRSAVYAGLAFDLVGNRVIAATKSGDVTALRAIDGQIAWTVDAGAPVRGAPLVAGSSLYVPTDKALLKLDLATGRRQWASSLGKAKAERLPIDDPNSRYDDFASSAVLSGDSVYAGSRDGCVYRFNAESGSTIGRYCAADVISATPVVDGNRVYFASFDRHVYAAERDTGRIVWTRDVHGAVPRDLALAGNNILAGSRSYDLVALNKNTGKPAWTRYYWFSWVDSVPNVIGPTIYIGSSDSLRVYALNNANGHKLWETVVPGWTWAKPAVGRRTVYAAVTGTSTRYMGPRLGGLAAIDKGNGKLRWLLDSEKQDKVPEYGFASAPVIAGGKVYAADLAGHVYAFRDD